MSRFLRELRAIRRWLAVIALLLFLLCASLIPLGVMVWYCLLRAR